MTEQVFHYSSDAVDVDGRDLPGLKAAFVVGHVPDGTTLVDVGCGGGKMLRTIAAHRSGVTLLGCDVVAPSRPDDAFNFSPVDAADGRLPYDDACVDVVLVFDVLEHVHAPEAMLAEARRILRPEGVLVAFVPVEGERIGWYRLFRRLLGQDLYGRTKGHVQAFTHDGLDAMLGRHFDVTERRYAYHPLGQLMDASLCAAMSLEVVRRSFWDHSPFHGDADTPPSVAGRAFVALLRLANALAWAESTLLRRVRFGSAGQLLAARIRADPGAAAPPR
jgi:SAM-dependent methyltransferase